MVHEGERGRRSSALAGAFDDRSNNPLVSGVDAVEGPDGGGDVRK
jgi:hypothetical protein